MNLAGSNLELAKKLQKILQERMDPAGTAASVAFIKDGELLAACAVGTQDGNPDHPATVGDLYNVGSVSKVYCALAVMKLVEMGKVTLDEPVVNYLPRFVMRDPRHQSITLRHCLNHSSGLPGTDMKNSFASVWMEGAYTEHFYDYMANSQLKAEPGYFSVYCNDGFTLAEMVIAEVSGMSFTAFMQKYITFPLGAHATCSAENNPQNRVRIQEKDKQLELVSCTGAGGIATDMTDCAKLGYMFIESQGIFKEESLAETAKRQSVTFLPDKFNAHYGLGWDRVEYINERCDFGPGVLVKGGGTLSFGSYLMVIPKYNLAAAISGTNNARMGAAGVLVELCGTLLSELGISTWLHPIPEGWQERYSGIYHSGSALMKVELSYDQLSTKAMEKSNWRDRERGAFYEDGGFISGRNKFFFVEQDKVIYLSQETPVGVGVMVEKHLSYPPIHQGWQERVGKKYILYDGNPGDLFLGEMCGVKITAPTAGGPLVFVSQFVSTTKHTAVLTTSDNDTEMFLNAPGNSSRDGFAPFYWEKNGIGHLYFGGFNGVDSESLSYLASGSITSLAVEQNAVFKLAPGMKLKLNLPEQVRLIMADEELTVYYDSYSPKAKEIPTSKEGFILFINAVPMDFAVELEEVLP
ncbi:MAG: beta-lactamase family protein [Symbiobacteriaceae bacterium]|nr:beta-lactamase family protein [Symbiobacteriaceae bacterium]